ncbi:MAG: hypothetical protein R3F65_21825 [bacterium]
MPGLEPGFEPPPPPDALLDGSLSGRFAVSLSGDEALDDPFDDAEERDDSLATLFSRRQRRRRLGCGRR